MKKLSVHPCKTIEGALEIPGDKSISHLAIIFGALADGFTHVTGFLPSEDCLCTLRIFQALGVSIEEMDDTALVIEGVKGEFKPSREFLDCGNSDIAMHLNAGLLAGQPFPSRLFGDALLSQRPMQRIITPLRQMGARITALGEKGRPPLHIDSASLNGIRYESPVASAQLKTCLLLAGLFANGMTTVVEPETTRDHTERILAHFHAAPKIEGRAVSVHGGTRLHGADFKVPGDFSSAAFWIVAAAVAPRANLTLLNVGLNPTRTGLLGVLLRMGAQIRESVEADASEPYGTLQIRGGRLSGTTIAGKEIPNVIDELPILTVAGALAEGETIIEDASELRVKETDQIAAMVANLRAFGVDVEEQDDGMIIHGGAPLHAAHAQSYGDPRIAMACAILGLFAKGTSLIDNADCIATSYPTFERDLAQITAASASTWQRIWAFQPV